MHSSASRFIDHAKVHTGTAASHIHYYSMPLISVINISLILLVSAAHNKQWEWFAHNWQLNYTT